MEKLNSAKNMSIKVGLIGAVGSSAKILKALKRYDFDIVGVLGHEPKDRSKVSGWYNLSELSNQLNIDFKGFERINNPECIEWMRQKKADLIFAVGFSQILSNDWLKMTHLGCIGFHPTLLPLGRGRAPLAWIILNERKGAATFFLMTDQADGGPIFVQEKFTLSDNDDAFSTKDLINNAIDTALDKWLPDLKKGIWNPIPQDDSAASWYGKRESSDGNINWNLSADKIDRLIKATTFPHPGAYTYFQKCKMIIWNCQVEKKINIQGVTGRILLKSDSNDLLVQCGDGIIWLTNYSCKTNIVPSVGNKLGYNFEDEITSLWEEISKLKK